MRNKNKVIWIIGIFVLSIVSLLGCGETKDTKENTTSKKILKGKVQVIENFNSPELNNNKTIRIYLPYNYEKSGESYPVIYMNDGQNLYDPSTATYGKEWNIDQSLNLLFTDKKNEGFKGYIVVGIDSNDKTRTDEYNPFKYNADNVNHNVGGKGDKYSEFIVKTLKPYIESNYRTLSDKENTTIIGSSYGAVSAIYTAIEYNEVFGNVGVFSYYDNINKQSLITYMKENLIPEKIGDTKIYIYSGNQDFAYNSTVALFEICRDNGLKNIKMDEDMGSHDELSWGPKFKNCIEFFNSK